MNYQSGFWIEAPALEQALIVGFLTIHCTQPALFHSQKCCCIFLSCSPPRTQPLFTWICECQQVGKGVRRERLPGCSKGPSVWAGNAQSQPSTQEHLSASSSSPTAKVTHHRRASCAKHWFNTEHPRSSLWGHVFVVSSHFKNRKFCLIESWSALSLLPTTGGQSGVYLVRLSLVGAGPHSTHQWFILSALPV